MRVSGSIDFIELDKLKIVLFGIFGKSKLKSRTRIFGDQFSLVDNESELHIETFNPIPMKKPRYNLDWDIKKPLKESLMELNTFINKLRSKNVSYCIAFYPIDEDESVEIELRSIGYYNEYEQMKIKCQVERELPIK